MNGPSESFRRRMIADIEVAGGRHDEPEIYAAPGGDELPDHRLARPPLTGTHQPDSVQRFSLAPADRLKARRIRRAHPAPPCVAMAQARASAEPEVVAPVEAAGVLRAKAG